MQETLNLVLSELQNLRGDINRLETRLDKLAKDIFQIRLLVENEISKKIDIIGEGHDFLKQNFNDALQMERKRERMELEIVNLQIEVKKIKEHLDIT